MSKVCAMSRWEKRCKTMDGNTAAAHVAYAFPKFEAISTQ